VFHKKKNGKCEYKYPLVGRNESSFVKKKIIKIKEKENNDN
jgi:hypothetical protein